MDAVDKLIEIVKSTPEARLRAAVHDYLVREDMLKKVGKTPFELAMEKLKTGVQTMPPNFEFEIPQVIGAEIWAQMDRGSKLAMGKHVKASQEAYGVKFLRTSTSNHAIYCRAE